jgi:hypothetical protein
LSLVVRATEFPAVQFCVTVVAAKARTRAAADENLTRAIFEEQARLHANVSVRTGDTWRVVPQLEPCGDPAPAP